MKKLLLKPICIDINSYRPNAGWIVDLKLPQRLLQKTMTIRIDCPGIGYAGEWDEDVRFLEIDNFLTLDDILVEIVDYIRDINAETGGYFDRYHYLAEIILDTESMQATTVWRD